VARSAEKIENLRALVEHFGQESKNRVLANKAVAPVWVIVTSQEKLNEVVAAIDDKRVELAKLQDRFHYRVDMAPADIREVATRRVLSKTDAAEKLLRGLYKDHSAQLKTHTQPERSQIKFDVSEDDFVQFYPYLPYFVELSIDVVSGLRLQAAAPRHFGGSNRTIIKQAYEMLVSDRTRLADAPIGTLVTWIGSTTWSRATCHPSGSAIFPISSAFGKTIPGRRARPKSSPCLNMCAACRAPSAISLLCCTVHWETALHCQKWNAPSASYMTNSSSARRKMAGSCSPPRRKTGLPSEIASAQTPRNGAISGRICCG
jgi:hypothetical protein